MHKQILTTGFVLFSFVLPLKATATNFREIYVFGDSLSDVGNVLNVTSSSNAIPDFPAPPYFPGRFSNGPVWVEYLAQELELSPTPYTDVAGGANATDGINYAFGGATTGSSNTINDAFSGATTGSSNTIIPGLLLGLEQQINNFTAANPSADPNALYIIWAGGNDYLGGSATNPNVPINNLSSAVTSLYKVGARYIMVVNLPDLGRFPGSDGNSQNASSLNALSSAHNLSLAATLNFLSQTPDINIIPLDVNFLFDRVFAAPGEFGFTNVTTPCLTRVGVCANPNEYLFWDNFRHPTTAGHQLVASLAFRALQAKPVPEPSTELGILALGALGAVSVLQRLQKKASRVTGTPPS